MGVFVVCLSPRDTLLGYLADRRLQGGKYLFANRNFSSIDQVVENLRTNAVKGVLASCCLFLAFACLGIISVVCVGSANRCDSQWAPCHTPHAVAARSHRLCDSTMPWAVARWAMYATVTMCACLYAEPCARNLGCSKLAALGANGQPLRPTDPADGCYFHNAAASRIAQGRAIYDRLSEHAWWTPGTNDFNIVLISLLHSRPLLIIRQCWTIVCNHTARNCAD